MQWFGHLDPYGGKFIRASIALYCGSLRTGSSSQVTLSESIRDLLVLTGDIVDNDRHQERSVRRH
jgi:hypothetical protein